MTVPAAPELGGPDVPARLAEALRAVCAAAGLDPEGAEMLRFVNNGVFRLVRQPVVVRIVLTPSLAHRAQNVVRAATWLAEHDVPAVRLLPGVPQPLRAGPHLATLWQAVPETGPEPSAADLARLLRQVHELPAPPFALGEWRPLDDVRHRLTAAEVLADDDREFFQQRCDAVEAALPQLNFPLPPALVHGDAHLGNVIPGPDGPVLCDFDSTAFGPPEWDLTPLAVGQIRFGHPRARYAEFAEAYGFDVTSWEGFDVLREIRELKLTAGVLPILRRNPEVRAEFDRRLRSFREGDRTARWEPYR